MGKRSSRKKVASMFDSDDTDSSSSSSSSSLSMPLDSMVTLHIDKVQVDKDSLLDQCLDALYEKRGSSREKALGAIIDAFNSTLQHEFVEKKFATLLNRCLHSIKKGSAKEVALASHVIGLLAITIGPGNKAQEILEESLSPISEALRTRTETPIFSLLQCLAVITFVGGDEDEQTEKAMQIMWQMVHPKLGNNVVTSKPSPALITMVISAWAFLLTTVDEEVLNSTRWQECISYLSALLDKDDRLLRIAAGEALALLLEAENLEKFCGEETKVSGDSSNDEGYGSGNVMYIHGLRNKVLSQVRALSVEAGGKGYARKDLNNQRNTFRDILSFLEEGSVPEISIKIGGESLKTSTWDQLIQLNFLKHFLGQGFAKHMKENQFLHEVFEFTPKKKMQAQKVHPVSPYLHDDFRVPSMKMIHTPHELRSPRSEKRLYKSPNSTLNKARTQILNKQRMFSQDKNAGYFAVGVVDY